MIKKTITLGLKFGFAFGLVFWLFRSGKLDLSMVGESFKNPVNWFIACTLGFCNILVTSQRWKHIVETNLSHKLPFLPYLKLTWIGALFSTVLPGAVSGDFIKMIYARKLDTSLTKSFLLMSVLIDRILGLVGLVVLMGAMSLINYSDLVTISPAVKKMVHFNFLVFAGALFFVVGMFIPEKFQNKFLELNAKIPKLGLWINKIFSNTWLIGKNKKVVLYVIGLSIITQSFNITAFWFLTKPFYGTDLSLSHVFSFVPIGQISVAIPITPAGLGVGHAVYDTLFGYFNVQKGASLFNLFFILTVCMNCLGIIPYLFSDMKISNKEMQEFEQLS